MKVNIILSVAVFTAMILMTGCSSDDETTPANTQPSVTAGYLIDSPIAGVHYACGSRSGMTDSVGKFECTEVPITFSIGHLIIGVMEHFTSDSKVYPQDLLGLARTNYTDSRLIALTRLLQSLDDDGNVTQVINITQERSDSFGDDESFNESNLDQYASEAGVVLVSEEDAIDHLRGTIENDDGTVPDETPEDDDMYGERSSLITFDAAFLEDSDASRYYALVCSDQVRDGQDVAHFDLLERSYTATTMNGQPAEGMTISTFDNALIIEAPNNINYEYRAYKFADYTEGAPVVIRGYLGSRSMPDKYEFWFPVGAQTPGSSDSRQGHCGTNDWRDIDEIRDLWYTDVGGNLWTEANHEITNWSCGEAFGGTIRDVFEILQNELDRRGGSQECPVYQLGL